MESFVGYASEVVVNKINTSKCLYRASANKKHIHFDFMLNHIPALLEQDSVIWGNTLFYLVKLMHGEEKAESEIYFSFPP